MAENTAPRAKSNAPTALATYENATTAALAISPVGAPPPTLRKGSAILQPDVRSLLDSPVRFDTLNLLPSGLVSPNGRFPSLAPEVHFASKPRVSPSHEPLVAVSASYAALTLRCQPQMLATRGAYSLVLLSAWLWDDTIDHNKAQPSFDQFVDFALSGFATELGVDRESVPSSCAFAPSLPALFPVSLLEPINDAQRLLGESVAIIHRDLAPYSSRILATWWDFWRSFAAKAKVELDSPPPLAEYERLRSTCVGMYLCYDLAYAIKATSRGIPAETMLAYLENDVVAQGARLSSLHCAAVNDLFSLYKDRQVEHTVNFPAVLAKGASVDGYWEGARRTVLYTRSLVEQVLNIIENLPGPRECAQVVAQTWLEMMEGNALFHLTVPRYAEGVALVKSIIDEDVPPEESRRTFRRTFPPAARPSQPAARNSESQSCPPSA